MSTKPKWRNVETLESNAFTCGFCGHLVSSDVGYHPFDPYAKNWNIFICSHCKKPTFFCNGKQHPGVSPGADVGSLPNEIEKLYLEARNSVAADAPTASVLAPRKLLMNIAVSKGAQEGKQFVEYVEYLAEKGYVPPDGRGWVDHIRSKGNEANHKIALMTHTEAKELIDFSEMLLKLIFDFPGRLPGSQKQPVKI
jgi:hypothetical protein